MSPTSVTAGGGATLTLTSAITTPPGVYPLTVTGTAPSGSHSTGYTLTVTSACPTATQQLGNPGFESGNTVWASTPNVISTGASGAIGPHAGKRYAWLDGYGRKHTDTLTQAVTLPLGCRSYPLVYWIKIVTAETSSRAVYDKLTVTVGSTTLASYSNLNKSSGYVQRTFDLSAFAGSTVTLSFKGVEDGSLATSFLIDDTSVTTS